MAVAGVAAMIFGPVSMIVGGVVLSAGLGGVSNAVSQENDDTSPDFSTGKFLGHVVVNGIVGGVTAGAGTAI